MNRTNRPFGEVETATIMRNVLKGLAYLSANKKIHRDVKSDNILMNIRGECKLGRLEVCGQIPNW